MTVCRLRPNASGDRINWHTDRLRRFAAFVGHRSFYIPECPLFLASPALPVCVRSLGYHPDELYAPVALLGRPFVLSLPYWAQRALVCPTDWPELLR